MSVAVEIDFASGLARFGQAVAIIDGDTALSYEELDRRVESLGRQWGPSRQLLALRADNTVGAIITYLAALRFGHPILLHSGSVPQWFTPSIEVSAAGLQHRILDAAPVELDPELAVLLSTSGSTGAPKLVRLSRTNLTTNARDIAHALGLRGSDRGITSLPLGYSYGLSVVNSHLAVGAGVILSNESVLDPCFWRLVDRWRPTSLPAVPYTLQMLANGRFTDDGIPSLRRVTVAGGRLSPDQVKGLVAQGERQGWDLYVMYGQTEATARMAVLAPELARSHPQCVGRPVGDGSFWIIDDSGRRWDGSEPDYGGQVGELYYRGSNVMLGYGTGAADLSRGREVGTLPTGDRARFADGLLELVGRRADLAKIGGLRVDLCHVEELLRERGVSAVAVEHQQVLAVLYEQALGSASLAGRVSEVLNENQEVGLPRDRIQVLPTSRLPRTPSGKLDRSRAQESVKVLFGSMPTAAGAEPPERTSGPADRAARLAAIRSAYAQALPPGTLIRDDRSFSQLGGDSLSYVSVSTRLGAVLGRLPGDWHLLSINELGGREPLGAKSLDTSTVLRAVAILVVVSSHIGLTDVRGGAHLLLAVAGFNFARFQLSDVPLSRRRRNLASSFMRLLLPTALWLAVLAVFVAEYSPVVVFGLNLFGPDSGPEWRYWFIEALAFLVLGASLLMSTPLLDRWQRRRPSWFAVGVLGVGLALLLTAERTATGSGSMYTPVLVAWLFGLGWLIATARSRPVKLLIGVLAVGLCVFYFDGSLSRQLVVAGGLVLLISVPAIPVPRPVAATLSVLASASLFIYLTHYQVYPIFGDQRLAGLLASVFFGFLCWYAVERVQRVRLPGPIRLGGRRATA